MSQSQAADPASRNGRPTTVDAPPNRMTSSNSGIYHEVFENFIDLQATGCPRLRVDIELSLQPFQRHIQPQPDLVCWAVNAVINGDMSIEEAAKSNARMELHSDEKHESMRRTANMVLAAVCGLLEVMDDSANRVIAYNRRSDRFRLWSAAGKFSLGTLLYTMTLLMLMAVSLFGCGLVASQLASDMLNLDGMTALLAGILPALALFSGIKSYISQKDFVISQTFRLVIFVGSLLAVAANFLLLGSQSFDPENLGGNLLALPPSLSFMPILAIDAISIIGQAVLWNDLQRLRALENAEEHPAFQIARDAVATESNLVSQLRVHEARAQDALKWLEDRSRVLELKHESAIRQQVNLIRRDGEKAIAKSLKKLAIPITSAVLCLGFLGCNQPPPVVAPQREVFVGVASTASSSTLAEFDSQIRKLIKALAPGSCVHLLDLADHHIVATLVVPERWNAGSLRGLGTVDALESFTQFFSTIAEIPPDAHVGLDLSAVFKVVASARRLSDASPEVILCVDPRYDTRPNWSFHNGRCPSDACIGHSSTPFGVARDNIDGTQLLLVVPHMNWGSSGTHEDRVERFWRLYCQRSRVQLHDFRSDLPGAFATVISQGYAAVPVETPAQDVFVGLYSEAGEMIQELEGPTNQIQIRPISTRNPNWEDGKLHIEIPKTTTQALDDTSDDEFAFAINWWPTDSSSSASQADLDIWVILHGEPDPRKALYFQNMETDFGRLLRDVVETGSASAELDWNSWEVAYVKANRLPELEILIGAYKVDGPQTVRLVSKLGDGPLHEQILQFVCPAGEGLRDFPMRSTSPYWLAINPLATSQSVID